LPWLLVKDFVFDSKPEQSELGSSVDYALCNGRNRGRFTFDKPPGERAGTKWFLCVVGIWWPKTKQIAPSS
jgi:hypothetical protein